MSTIFDRRTFAKGLAGAAAATGALALAGCSGEDAPAGSAGSAAASGTTYKIGVLQLTEHAALDAANDGFVKALDDSGISYEIEQQNRPERPVRVPDHRADARERRLRPHPRHPPRPLRRRVAGATSDIPIVGTAITDFAASDLVADNDAPGGNLTGTSDMNPVSDQIDLLQQLVPEAKTVGLLYCTAESNSDIQIAMAKEELASIGLTGVEYTVSSSNEIQSVVESMVGNVDAIYTPTDNTIAAAMTQVSSIANEAKIPTICGEVGMVENGGLASVSINYEELGYRAGKMAVEILTEGADPAEMPIETMSASSATSSTTSRRPTRSVWTSRRWPTRGGEDVSAA